MILKVDKLEAESQKAVAVLDTKGIIVWLPKSQITCTKKSKYTEIELPKWLAGQYPNLEVEEE